MSAYRDDQRALIERLQRENERLRAGRARVPVPPFVSWLGAVVGWAAIAVVSGDWLLFGWVAVWTGAAMLTSWLSGHEAGSQEIAREERSWSPPPVVSPLTPPPPPPPDPPRRDFDLQVEDVERAARDMEATRVVEQLAEENLRRLVRLMLPSEDS